MDFGVGYFPTHDGMTPGPLARLVEERGQAALLFAEHTHIPASRETPMPSGAELPQRYWHCYDPFIASMAAAAATTRLRVGTGVCLVAQRDPITTAKTVASVDDLSGGRFEFGVGIGWNREEMRNHGTDPRVRVAVVRERVEAMKAIWTQEEASYAGTYVSFERIWSYPKPAQRPHPPVLLGGYGPTVIDRVLAFADGWLPNWTRDPAFFDRLTELRQRADRPLEVQVLSVPPAPEVLERLAAAGVRRALHWLPVGGRSVVEPGLERWEKAIGEFTGS